MSAPVVVELAAQPFAYVSLHASIADIPKAMAGGFDTLSSGFARAGATMAGNPLTHYTDYDGGSASFDLGFPAREEEVAALRAAGLSIGRTPAGRNMTATHIGPYDTLSRTYNLIMEAMEREGLAGTRDMWEIYFSPPGTPPAQLRTDVVWPLRPDA